MLRQQDGKVNSCRWLGRGWDKVKNVSEALTSAHIKFSRLLIAEVTAVITPSVCN